MNDHSPHLFINIVVDGGLILWPIRHERTFIVGIHISIAKRSPIILCMYFTIQEYRSRSISYSLSFVQLPAFIICSSLNRLVQYLLNLLNNDLTYHQTRCHFEMDVAATFQVIVVVTDCDIVIPKQILLQFSWTLEVGNLFKVKEMNMNVIWGGKTFCFCLICFEDDALSCHQPSRSTTKSWYETLKFDCNHCI